MIGKIRRNKKKNPLYFEMIGKMKRKKNIELVYVEYRWNPTAGLSSKFHWQINTINNHY